MDRTGTRRVVALAVGALLISSPDRRAWGLNGWVGWIPALFLGTSCLCPSRQGRRQYHKTPTKAQSR